MIVLKHHTIMTLSQIDNIKRMSNKLLMLVSLVLVGCSCSSTKKTTNLNSTLISELITHSNGKLVLDEETTYYIDKSVILPSNFTLEGNGALISVKPQKEKIHSAFIIMGDNVTVKNINLESESLYRMVAHRDKAKFNPLTSNIYAFVNKDSYSNFKLLNSSFKDITIVLKLSRMRGILIDNVKGNDCQGAMYCQYCSEVVIRNMDFDLNNVTNKYTHHLYFNSVNDLSISNSKFSNGAGKAINIKVDNINCPSSKVRISNVQLDSTGGIFLTYVDDVIIDKLTSTGTKQLIICSSEVGNVKMSNSDVFCLDESGPTISALDNLSPVRSLSISKTNFNGPLNIEGHSVEHFIIDSCSFTNFFYDDLDSWQNVFYMKKEKYQGEFYIKNSRFKQSYDNKKSVFIRNETNRSFYFLNNEVMFEFPQKDLISSGKNSISHVHNNKMVGVRNVSNIMKSVKSIE